MSEEIMESLFLDAQKCSLCQLCKERTNVVFGEGKADSQIMFIGEAPGKKEDLEGKPFVGDAGKNLNLLLESIGLSKGDIYIANAIKCHPPNNRDPSKEEIAACAKWLDAQIEIINPAIIVSLGRIALNRFFPGKKMLEAHGKAKKENGRIYFAMYHPAAILYNRSLEETVRKDFKRLKLVLEKFNIGDKNG